MMSLSDIIAQLVPDVISALLETAKQLSVVQILLFGFVGIMALFDADKKARDKAAKKKARAEREAYQARKRVYSERYLAYKERRLDKLERRERAADMWSYRKTLSGNGFKSYARSSNYELKSYRFERF